MSSTTPFHVGETAIQQRAGVRREDIEPLAQRMIRDFMPDQHRAFYQSLPFIVLAARDANDRPWATLLAGDPGFIQSPDPRLLAIDAKPVAGDALAGALVAGSDLGLLGIDPATRRRNRVNGRLIGNDDSQGLQFAVDQSFGNCPQYIHPRDWTTVAPESTPAVVHHQGLTPALRTWIETADTFFIASGHRDRDAGDQTAFGMDASHRGGDPGFVRVAANNTLIWPDYAGNNHFNTLGNLALDPRIGLLFVNFAEGHLLQISGRATIDWDSPAVATTPGAQRLISVTIDAVIEQLHAVPLRWQRTGATAKSLPVA